MSVTALAPRVIPAGEHRADQVPVGAHVVVGTRDVGRVVRVDQMLAIHPAVVEAVRTGFTDDVVGQPVLKFEIACSGGRTYYLARFPHEPVSVVEV